MKNYYKVPFAVILLFNCFSLFSNANASDVLPNRNKPETRPQNASFKDNPVPKTARKMDCGIPAPTIVNYGCLDLLWQKDYKLYNNNFSQTLESPKKIYPTNDGGYIFASNSQISPNNSGDSEYAIFKVDANGNRLWSKTYGTVDKDFLTAFVPTSDGGYILGGYSEGGINRDKTSISKGSNDIWLVKINANGTKIWDKSFGGADQDLLTSMIATSDGGFLLGGYSSSGNNGDKTDPYIGGYYDTWILKLDASGNKIWDKTFGGTGFDATKTVSETTDGYIIVAQSESGISGNKTSPSKGGIDFWIIKTDFTGTKIWENTYGGSNSDVPQAINKNADGSFIISGSSNSPISGDKSQKGRGLNDAWILKISSSGTKIWDKTIGGSNNEYVTSATTTPTGNIIFNVDSYSNISGDKKRTPISPNSTDQWLFEITPNGVQLWEKYLNGINGIFPNSGDLIVQNNYLISLGNADYSTTRQYDFWNIGLKKISYCNPQNISSTTICQAKCATLVATDCSSGVVKWSNGEYGASICASPNATQNYKSVCLSADSLCVGDSSAVFTVNVTPSDAVSISPSGFVNITACGTSQTITATGCANGTLTWSNGQTGNPITFIPTNNQIVRAICTMANGCVSESAYLSISVDRYNITSPEILNTRTYLDNPFRVVYNKTVCSGRPVTLTGNNNGGVSGWTGGVQGTTFTFTPIVNRTIKYITATPNGCTYPDSAYVDIIVVQPAPQPTIAKYPCLNRIWDKRFGGIDPEYFKKTIKLSDGYLLAGTSRSDVSGDKASANKGTTASQDYWIVKIDNNGNKVWDKTFGGNSDDILSSAIQLADGTFMLAGSSISGISGDKSEASRGGTDYWIVKVDANGNKLWDKTFGGSGDENPSYFSNANVDIKETSDGFVLGGISISGVSGDKTLPAIRSGYFHFWVLKLNQQGSKLWDKTFGGSEGDYFTALEVLANNECVLLGSSQSPASTTIGNKTSANKGGSDYWLIKIDANGDKIWDKSYGGSASPYNTDLPTSMVISNDGKITITGTSNAGSGNDKTRNSVGTGLNNSGAGKSDVWIIKVDSDGNKIWDKTYGSFGSDEAKSITLTDQGKYIISAMAPQFANKGYDLSQDLKGFQNADYWIMELGADGEKLWDKSFGGFGSDQVTNVIAETNSLVIGGTSFSGIGGDKSQTSQGVSDYWLIKTSYCTPDIGNSTTICKNDSVFLSVQSCANGNTIQWNNLNDYQTQVRSVKPSATTIYKAVCIGIGCASDTASYTVNVNTTPTPTITPSNTSICQAAGSVTLTASGCAGTFGWVGGATTSSISVSPTATKTYKLACIVNGCTSDSASVTITVATPNRPTLSPSTQSICLGASTTITASGCAGGTYSWTGGLTGTSILVSPTTTKSYKAVCTIGSCVSDSSLVSTITVNPVPSIPVINPQNPSTICAGNSVLLSVNNPLATGTYRWTGGLSGTSISVTPNISRNYRVNLSVNNCASDSSTAVNVTVQPKPIVTLTPSTNSPICVGQSITITASGCSTGTYTWTGGLTGTSITVSLTTNRTYKSACTRNGCVSDSASVSVSVSQASPLPTTTASSVCQGSSLTVGNGLKSTAPNCSGGASNVTATSSTITWWDVQTGGNQVGTGTEYLPTTNTLQAGTYTYYAQTACAGLCPSARVATVLTVSAKPNTPNISTNISTICSGSNATLTASGCTGGTYAWTGGLTGTSINVTPTATRNYKVACMVSGCVSDSSVVATITVLSGMYSIKTGNWEDVSTWSCNRVPLATDDVVISLSHIVTINDVNAKARNLINKAQLLMANTNSKLTIYGLQTISYISQPNTSTGKDAYIANDNINSNYGNAAYIHPYLGATYSANGDPIVVNRALLSFDMTSIPANAVIDSAFITLFYSQTIVDILYAYYGNSSYWAGHVGNNDMYIQRITQSWAENTVTWNNQPTVSASNRISVSRYSNNHQDYKIDVKMLVKDMILSPSSSYGFMFRLQDEVSGDFALSAFASSDEANPVLRPKFQVYYHLP